MKPKSYVTCTNGHHNLVMMSFCGLVPMNRHLIPFINASYGGSLAKLSDCTRKWGWSIIWVTISEGLFPKMGLVVNLGNNQWRIVTQKGVGRKTG
jgi:hypothetical protein